MIQDDMMHEDSRVQYAGTEKDEQGAPLGCTVGVIRRALASFDSAMPEVRLSHHTAYRAALDVPQRNRLFRRCGSSEPTLHIRPSLIG